MHFPTIVEHGENMKNSSARRFLLRLLFLQQSKFNFFKILLVLVHSLMGQSRKNEKESNKTKQNRAKEINVRIKKEWGKRKIWETREYIQTKNKGESKKKKRKKRNVFEKRKKTFNLFWTWEPYLSVYWINMNMHLRKACKIEMLKIVFFY